MSLIVARKLGKHIYIVSDTKLTDPYANRLSPTQGVIKSSILRPDFCVSFAGIAEFADEALKAFNEIEFEHDFLGRAIQHFLKWHIDVEHKTEFILAFGEPYYSLIEIKEGRHSPSVSSWLGDKDAFSRFQAYYHNALVPTPTPLNAFSIISCESPEGENAHVEVFSGMVQAMMNVITDTDIKEVGHFTVPVAYEQGSFKFMSYQYVLTHSLPLETMPESFAVPFGTTAEGGYSFSFSAPEGSNLSAAAMYLLQGNLGILFTSQEGGLLRPTPYLNVPPIEFVEKVKSEFGIEMRCHYVRADTYGSRARCRHLAGDFEGSLADSNKSIEMDPKDPRSYRGRAALYADMGEENKAIEDWTRAIELEPNHVPTYLNRGLAYGRIGMLDRAISDLSKAIELDPNYAGAYQMRALAYHLKGDSVRADQDMGRFKELENQ